MHGCTETDNKVVIGCYKADLWDRNRNGLRHCQFDQVKFMLSKSALSREALLNIIVHELTAALEVFHISRPA